LLAFVLSVFVPVVSAQSAQAAPQAAPQTSPASAKEPGVVKPGENLVVENIPPIPTDVAEKVNRYGEFRSAGMQDWHPTRRELLITTRFADVPQVHLVKTPGGARTQLTFYPDRVA